MLDALLGAPPFALRPLPAQVEAVLDRLAAPPRPPIEDTPRDLIAEATRTPAWEVYLQLDNLLVELSSGADQRLAWHSAQPV
jgi:hypothetical protein